MKKNITTATIALAILTSLAVTSCKKTEMVPNEAEATSVTNEGTQLNENNAKGPLFIAGILSNNGFPSNGSTECGFYSASNAPIGQAPATIHPFGGLITSTVKCFAATTAFQAFIYRGLDNNLHMQSGTTALDGTFIGNDYTLLLNGTTLFNLAIEEIEVMPGTTDVYALVRYSNTIRLYKIDATGNVTLMSNSNGSTTIFNSTNTNGYKSGSICFAPSFSNPSLIQLVFTNESTVYSSLGLVSWHFNISGNIYTSSPSDHRTYSTATSGIPGAQTGKINTAYNTETNEFYFARDNSNLYKLNQSANNTSATQLTTTPLINSNDFGYYRNW
jgi:hypothetical protein